MSTNIVSGQFSGGEIENGTFHEGNLPASVQTSGPIPARPIDQPDGTPTDPVPVS
jgi:hypothetical protein